MTTPSAPNPISINDINVELGSPGTTLRTLNDAAVRTLAGPAFTTPGSTISLNDLRGKSNSVSATGGTVIDSGGYRIHVFTSPGSFVVSNAGPGTVEYLVVAGGGGGAGNYNAGGAGGFRTATGFPVTATTYPITVGGGGAAGPYGNNASNGNPSIFSTITSAGGGYGANGEGTQNNPGGPGGSGGGGWWAQGGLPTAPALGVGNTPPVSPPQGNPSGYGYSTLGGGGGGGAGAAGGNATPNPASSYYRNGGPGGIGSPISWLPASYGTPGPAPGRYFAGGGGGSSGVPGTPPALGGAGGGGNGGVANTPSPTVGNGTPGTTNTGGGGGGGATFALVQNGGSGGSGIVAIRYPI